jgi:hypothetical protein
VIKVSRNFAKIERVVYHSSSPIDETPMRLSPRKEGAICMIPLLRLELHGRWTLSNDSNKTGSQALAAIRGGGGKKPRAPETDKGLVQMLGIFKC